MRRQRRITAAGAEGRYSGGDGRGLIRKPTGTTIARGAVTDQAELYGLLAKVCDLGPTLI